MKGPITRNNILWDQTRKTWLCKSTKSSYQSLEMTVTHADRHVSLGLFADVNFKLFLCSTTTFFFLANLICFMKSPYVQWDNYYDNYSKTY